MGKGAKTKGWIKNNTTGELKNFQFNPTELDKGSRGSVLGEVSSPGLPYPLTQWVRGELREFPVEIYMHDAPVYTGTIDDFENFLEQFLAPETNVRNYVKPPSMTFCYGNFVRKCVLVSYNNKVTLFDESLKPTEATFSLTLRQVGI